MQVYEFMLPTHSNSGEAFDHAAFDDMLAAEFGGYTKLAPAIGYWRDENIGQVFEETVIPYRVATDRDAESIVGPYIAAEFDQLAVYVGRIGTAEIRVYQ